MNPHDTTLVDRHNAFIAKQHMHRQVWLAESFRATCVVMNHNIWFAENSRAPALWRHDRDVNKQSKHGDIAELSRATCHVHGRKFGAKSQCKRDKKYGNLNRKV